MLAPQGPKYTAYISYWIYGFFVSQWLAQWSLKISVYLHCRIEDTERLCHCVCKGVEAPDSLMLTAGSAVNSGKVSQHLSRWISKTSKDSDFTASLGKLTHCLTACGMRKRLRNLSLNPSFQLLPSELLPYSTDKSLALSTCLCHRLN